MSRSEGSVGKELVSILKVDIFQGHREVGSRLHSSCSHGWYKHDVVNDSILSCSEDPSMTIPSTKASIARSKEGVRSFQSKTEVAL